MAVLDLMTTRRTYRRFAQKPVPQAVIDSIAAAVRLSSSARNAQPIRLLAVRKPETVRQVNALVKWAGALPPELGTPKPDELPTLFIAVLQDTSLGGEQNTDAGIALANMTLAAWESGVGSCIMQAINRPALTELFGLPEHLHLHSMVAFGYPTHKSTVVPLPEGGSVKYYLDENRDYFVPKRPAGELISYFD